MGSSTRARLAASRCLFATFGLAVGLAAQGTDFPAVQVFDSGEYGAGTVERQVLPGEGWEDSVFHTFVPHGVDETRTYPLVLCLHGNNQDPKNFIRRIRKVSTPDHPVIVAMPWYQRPEVRRDQVVPRPLELFDRVLGHMLEHYPIDRGRVVLMGFSRGSSMAVQWLDSHSGQQRPDPVCAVWLCGSARIPSSPCEVPFSLFVGEKETAVNGTLNILASVRDAYGQMVARGMDVEYLEVPGMEHDVDGRCREVMRQRLAAFPDYSQALPARLRDALPTAAIAASSGDFGAAFAELDKTLAGSDLQLKAEARKAIRALRAFVTQRVDELARGTRGGADARELDLLAGQLSGREAARVAAALKKLDRDSEVQREVQARLAFTAALATPDSTARREALVALATGELASTPYGHRAQSHLQSLGLQFTSPQIPPTDPETPRRP